jgi:predicted DNA-binding transcriptional regulator YafY
MRDADHWVLRVDYTDDQQITRRRYVSPIRWAGEYAMVALCLGREEPRRFRISGIQSATLIPAAVVLMPSPMTLLHPLVAQNE